MAGGSHPDGPRRRDTAKLTPDGNEIDTSRSADFEYTAQSSFSCRACGHVGQMKDLVQTGDEVSELREKRLHEVGFYSAEENEGGLTLRRGQRKAMEFVEQIRERFPDAEIDVRPAVDEPPMAEKE